MKRLCKFCLTAALLSGTFQTTLAQYSRNYSQSRSSSSGVPDYPLSCDMFGIVGGLYLTSNPDMTGYDTKKNYTDYGGGFVYDYRREYNENSAFEFLMSAMLASSSTSHTEEGEDKMKVTFPAEARFYLGTSYLKLYLGAGLQYNFIWSLKNSGNDYYGYSGTEDSTGAHQLSGNGGVGLCILGLSSRVHFLLGAKFHFPIINNAEGTEYSNGRTIDFSKDKTSVAATASFSLDVIRQRCVWMVNYDYPLGNTTVSNDDQRNFFERKSMSLTTSLLWVI